MILLHAKQIIRKNLNQVELYSVVQMRPVGEITWYYVQNTEIKVYHFNFNKSDTTIL